MSGTGGESSNPDAAQIGSREQFGLVLTGIRKAAGLSIRKVADKAAVPAPTLGGWFAGKAVPAADAAEYLEKVLQVCGAPDQFEALWEAANRVRGIARPARPANSPYRSLAPYRSEDAELFFGRDDLIAELDARVADGLSGIGPRLIGVPGASGSGKSSLLQAGLLVSLAKRNCPARYMVPGADPYAQLDEALEGLGNPDHGTVLIVDQAEELWTYTDTAPDDDMRISPSRFVDRLADLTHRGVVIVFAIRVDFFAHAFEIPALERALTTDAVPVGPMSSRQLAQAITEPAKTRGAVIEPALVTMLLQELAVAGGGAHDPGALPLLSHALHETWVGRTTVSNMLTVEHYRSTGGIRKAIGQTAEKVWEQLDSQQQSAAERLFTRAVHRGDTGLARIIVRPAELDWLDVDRGATEMAIDKFVAARMLTTTRDGVQITHEALLHAWEKLGEWIETDTAGHVMHARLAELTRSWNRDDPSTLLSAARTEDYQQWSRDPEGRILTVTETEYLEASVAHHAAVAEAEALRIRRLRILVAALVVTVVVLIPVTVFAFKSRSDAISAEQQAQTSLNLAISRQAITKGEQVADNDPMLAQQLSLVAYRMAPTVESRSALLDSTTFPIARRTAVPELTNADSAALSTDETLLAVADGAHVQVIDRRRRGEMSPLVPLPEIIPTRLNLEFRPRSAILSFLTSRSVQLWDFTELSAPRLVLEILHGSVGMDVDGFSWSADGSELALADRETIRRWTIGASLEQSELSRLHREPLGPLVMGPGLTYSPDRRWLVGVGPNPKEVQLWDTSAVLRPRILRAPDPVEGALAFQISDDSTTLTVRGRYSTTARINLTGPGALTWTVADATVANGTAADPGVAAAEDSYSLVDDDSADIVIADSAGRRNTLPGPFGKVLLAQRFDPAVILVPSDGFIREWSLPRPPEPPAVDVRFDEAQMDQRARTALLQTDGGLGISVLDLSEPDTLRVQELKTSDYAQTPSITADGRFAAVEFWARSGSRVQILDLQDSARPRALGDVVALEVRPTWALAVTPSADAVFVAAGESIFKIDPRDPTARHMVAEIPNDTGEFVFAMQVSPDGRWLAVGTSRAVIVYDTSSLEFGRPAGSWQVKAHWFRFSPDSATLISGTIEEAGEATLWDLSQPGRMLRLSTVQGPQNQAGHFRGAAAINSARTRLALATSNEVWIWDISDPSEPTSFATLRKSAGSVSALAYSDDDSTLTALQSANGKATIRTWPSDTASVADDFCERSYPRIDKSEWLRYFPDTAFTPPCPG
ncbi:hypothetical protein [Nocardia sp. XZ_19_369]|uniref:nSTAND1 domain-containing NTPase n=1 Tax=Nocardia sp. XZ_19_369 TaxID=2769487 RepID=UPI0018909248|nr:hypothetical protein [Nocardia sp. XZ_19_369]